MDGKEFISLRKKLNKTQKEMSLLLGTSLKAIHSYEQGWRNVPIHAERQLYYLVSRINAAKEKQKPCWTINRCPPRKKKSCPAWEFQSGTLCWFINGTICDGTIKKNWQEKIEICKTCKVWKSFI